MNNVAYIQGYVYKQANWRSVENEQSPEDIADSQERRHMLSRKKKMLKMREDMKMHNKHDNSSHVAEKPKPSILDLIKEKGEEDKAEHVMNAKAEKAEQDKYLPLNQTMMDNIHHSTSIGTNTGFFA